MYLIFNFKKKKKKKLKINNNKLYLHVASTKISLFFFKILKKGVKKPKYCIPISELL